MNLPRTSLLALAVCLAVGAPMVAAAGASGGPVAHAATATCSGVMKINYGNGYYTKLVVTGLSCASGKTVMIAHHKCRIQNGIKGRCPSVLGYSCTEKRGAAISTEYNSRVTCVKGSRKVVYYYTQNLH